DALVDAALLALGGATPEALDGHGAESQQEPGRAGRDGETRLAFRRNSRRGQVPSRTGRATSAAPVPPRRGTFRISWIIATLRGHHADCRSRTRRQACHGEPDPVPTGHRRRLRPRERAPRPVVRPFSA